MDHNLTEVWRFGRVLMGGVPPPVILNLLITSHCDMRCAHCFFTEALNDRPRKARQMTTAQIVRISETLGGHLPILIVAGGEPFVRTDLTDIVQAFVAHNQLDSVYLMSNGSRPGRIVSDVARMLAASPRLNVTVALGIDGVEEDHDRIRGRTGSWARAIETAEALQRLQRDQPRLAVQTCTCMMRSNQDRIFDWYAFLRSKLKPDKISINYIRPPAADPRELEVDVDRYHEIAAAIERDSRRGIIKNQYQGRDGCFKAAVDVYMHGLIVRTEIEHKAQLRCFAGTTSAVIYDEGTLSTCENLAPVGSLRDVDWNFQTLWHGPALTARRRAIKNGCFCTHESNCYYPSLPFNPKHLLQIKLLERRLKQARRTAAAAERS